MQPRFAVRSERGKQREAERTCTKRTTTTSLECHRYDTPTPLIRWCVRVCLPPSVSFPTVFLHVGFGRFLARRKAQSSHSFFLPHHHHLRHRHHHQQRITALSPPHTHNQRPPGRSPCRSSPNPPSPHPLSLTLPPPEPRLVYTSHSRTHANRAHGSNSPTSRPTPRSPPRTPTHLTGVTPNRAIPKGVSTSMQGSRQGSAYAAMRLRRRSSEDA